MQRPFSIHSCAAILAVATALLMFSVVARADQSLDEGPFGFNFQNPDLTRGFWFQAPTSFTVTSLMVPSAVGNDPQNIEIFTLDSAPTGSATPASQFHLLGYYQGVTGAGPISTDFSISAGQSVCILGARGTDTMNNAYGSNGVYVTFLDSLPITLTRLTDEGNLNTGPASSSSSEPITDPGSDLRFAQVAMTYTVPEPSTGVLSAGGLVLFGLLARHRYAHRSVA